ncbi:MAG: hypothetical protein JRH01_20255 [Deltaproteobacteria bacterium]|nr:hypothetical protein [Deltaproteobacteria bacterium]
MRPSSLLALLLLVSCSGSTATPGRDPSVVLSWAHEGAQAFEILRDGQMLGELRPDGTGGFRLNGASVEAALTFEEQRQDSAQAYPRRIRIEGRMTGSAVGFRNEYTLLAPAGPLPVEGYGLSVSGDADGTNESEHDSLRQWLAAQGLPADTRPFQELHEQETGRELRVWYEISGRRIDGRFGRLGGETPMALVESLFRSEGGDLKIHHKRPGENGRFNYHRQSLELADAITAIGEDALVAHECGCYGYAIAGDFMTLGSWLYHVEADWLDDRVGAEFFIGFERRAAFPWLGIGDRLRMRNLARRVQAFILKDASGERFAEVALELPDDPPASGLGPITYRVDHWSDDGERRAIARIEHDGRGIQILLSGTSESFDERLEQLDRLFAAMPVQVMRGDGVRDSHLLEIERLVDAVRLLEKPDEERLADFVSDIDAASAARKVGALLQGKAQRFVANIEALPPAPILGPGTAALHARTEDQE